MKNKLLTFIAFCSVVFSSCKFHVSGTDKNDEIDKDIRSEIHEMIDGIQQSFVSGDVGYLKSVVNKKILNNTTILDTIVAKGYLNKESVVTVLDEMYVKNPGSGMQTNYVASSISGHDYTFIFNPTSFNSYIVLLSVHNPDRLYDMMLSLIFNEGKNNWEVQYMQMSPYRYDGELASYYSDKAYQAHLAKNIIPAYVYTVFASALARPSAESFRYKNEGEMSNLYKMITDNYKQQYTLPIVVNTIDSKPKITYLGPRFEPLASFSLGPVVHYESRVLDNEKAVERENDLLHKEILSIFPGINEVSGHVLYKVNYIQDDKQRTMFFDRQLDSSN